MVNRLEREMHIGVEGSLNPTNWMCVIHQVTTDAAVALCVERDKSAIS